MMTGTHGEERNNVGHLHISPVETGVVPLPGRYG